jgi:hypothetical protein
VTEMAFGATARTAPAAGDELVRLLADAGEEVIRIATIPADATAINPRRTCNFFTVAPLVVPRLELILSPL